MQTFRQRMPKKRQDLPVLSLLSEIVFLFLFFFRIVEFFLTLFLTQRASSADLQVGEFPFLFILIPLNLCIRDMSATKKDRKNGHTAHLSLSAACGLKYGFIIHQKNNECEQVLVN